MTLKPLSYTFFSPGELKPAGWMRGQLRRQADGLMGNLDRVWPDVRDSAWIGGNREGWERVPYWLDGFIPLAYLLEDRDMQARAGRYIAAILERQQPDGWICPCAQAERRGYDPWAVLLICKVLSVWCACTGDAAAEAALKRCLLQFNDHLNDSSLHDWGAARWFEGLIPIFWLYERDPDERLLLLAQKLRVQGFDWPHIFASGLLNSCTQGWDYFSHIVNLAMMLKSEALYGRMDRDTGFAYDALQWLDEHHGTAAGIVNGDECLSGSSPIHGSELCGVVEFMFSCEQLFSVTGDPFWLDRLELAGFNALPAACSPDMWAHQYNQLANQAACYPTENRHFRDNSRDAHVFGLEPCYGCCTANFGQGFPKLALSAFTRAPDGLALAVPLPCELNTAVNGKAVRIQCDTAYPFRDRATLRIRCPEPAEFTLYIRVPGSAKAARIAGEAAQPGKMHRLRKVWQDETVDIAFDFAPEMLPRPNGLYALRRGPLTFSLPIPFRAERLEYVRAEVERRFPYCDYPLYPEGPWGFGFASDQFELIEYPLQNPFDPHTPALALRAKMREVAWPLEDGFCAPAPDASQTGGLREKELIPYGAAKLRMTEMPLLITPTDR